LPHCLTSYPQYITGLLGNVVIFLMSLLSQTCLNDIQEASSLQCPQAPSGKLDSLQKACEKKLSTFIQNLNHGKCWYLIWAWKKSWIPACPEDKYLSDIACPGKVLVCSFNDLVGRRLAWSPGHWASGNEKLLAQKENLLV